MVRIARSHRADTGSIPVWGNVFFKLFEKCVLCKKENNGIKHVVNECIELKDLRDKLINEFNNLDRKIEKLNTLEKIEYFYYSKNYSEKKEKKKKKKDNKGIKLIKTFNLEKLTIKKMNKL